MNNITDTTVTSAPVCPRCNGFIPNNDSPGAYIGALSRADNETYVCSECGTEEALIQFAHDGFAYPTRLWPLWQYESAAVEGCWFRYQGRLDVLARATETSQ